MSRNTKKIKLEDRCLEEMEKNEEYCGDNTHALACKIIYEDFGIILTPEIISKLRSIDRSRQKVLLKYTLLDLRSKSFDLEKNDREYYSE